MSKEQEPPAQPQRSNRDTKILDWLEQNMTSKLTQRGDDNQFQVKLNDSPPWEWSQRSPTIRGAVLAALENKDQFGTAQPQPRKEIKTGGTMRRVCSVCKAEFLGTGMDNLCSKHQPKRSGYSPNEFHKTTSEPASGEVISHEEMDRIEREHPPAAQPQCSDDIQRPQPDARVEKALRDYDEVRSLDKLPASGAASGEREPFDKFIAKVQATGEPPKEERGETQEQWTGSIGGLITASNKPIAVALDIDNAKAIADAHNAALDAEREKREQAEHSAKAWEDDSRAGKEIQKGLHAELLAALEVIEKHNNGPHPCHGINIDLSALREHDNKVRKPLVGLLGECRCKLDWSVTDGKFLAKIDAALAQAKEQP